MEFTPRNLKLEDVTCDFPRFVTPKEGLTPGKRQYECKAKFKTAEAAKYAEDNHLNVKTDADGIKYVSLKRNELRANGEPNGPPRVVDGNNKNIDASKIGNGSTINVILYQLAYDTAGRKGIFSSLTAVQVTDLVEYTGSANEMQFDIVGGGSITPTDNPNDASELF